jgi:hypothetical protein
MADNITIDDSEIYLLAADLGKAPERAGPKIVQALQFGATNVKKSWAQKLEGTPDVPHGARSITYDIITGPLVGGLADEVSAVIGAEDGRDQAPIVAVLEFGAPGQNLPPHGYGAAALQEETADFEYGLALAIGEPL